MNATTRYVIEKVKGRWTVFSLVEHSGKVFKNFVGDGPTRQQAELVLAKAKQAI